MILEFHPAAERELAEAAIWYEQAIDGLGGQFSHEVERATKLLLERPAIGVDVGYGRRRLPVRRFPFTIIYAVSPGVLYILAVAHDKRRPGYWRSRGAAGRP